MPPALPDYDKLEIRLTPGRGDVYNVEIESASGARGYGQFIAPAELDIAKFRLMVDPRNRRVRGSSRYLKAAQQFGAGLFGALVASPSVHEVYAAARREARTADRGMRVTLSLRAAPELAGIPWEFLYDRPRFLANHKESPVVRFVDLEDPPPPLRVEAPLRILGMVSRPKDAALATLDVEEEQAALRQRLGPLIDAGQVTLRWLGRATLPALQQEVDHGEDFHVFHYIGHGEYDEDSGESSLILEHPDCRAHRVGGQQLGELLCEERSLRLAVLNACETAQTARQDPLAGIATSLMEYDVPAVVAMQFAITDEGALIFADEFYRALAAGYAVDAAVTQARRALAAFSDVEWATPVLFMRVADGMLFDLRPNESPSDLDPGGTRAVAETSEPGMSTADMSAAALGPTDRQRYAHSRAETRIARTRAMGRETVVDLRDRVRGAGSVHRQPTMRRSRSWIVAAGLAIAVVGAAISFIVSSGRTGKPGLVLAAGTDPTVAVSSTGLVTIADRTTDNSIGYVQPGVKPWTRAAKFAAAGSPSIADSGGHIVISARSAADGSIWYTTVGAPQWTQTASQFVFRGSGDPKITVSSTGRVTVVDRGTKDDVWYVQPGLGSWTRPIYFTARGDPSISSADGHTVMAVRGRDDSTIWYLTPGAPRWLPTPRFIGASDPAVAVDGSGRITIVAVKAADDTVWYDVQPGRAPWRQMGGFTAQGDPSIAEAGRHIVVAARGARDGSIWYTAPGAASWTPTIDNFVASSNPAIGVSSSGQVTIAALSTKRTLWYVQPGLKPWTSTTSP